MPRAVERSQVHPRKRVGDLKKRGLGVPIEARRRNLDLVRASDERHGRCRERLALGRADAFRDVVGNVLKRSPPVVLVQVCPHRRRRCVTGLEPGEKGTADASRDRVLGALLAGRFFDVKGSRMAKQPTEGLRRQSGLTPEGHSEDPAALVAPVDDPGVVLPVKALGLLAGHRVLGRLLGLDLAELDPQRHRCRSRHWAGRWPSRSPTGGTRPFALRHASTASQPQTFA